MPLTKKQRNEILDDLSKTWIAAEKEKPQHTLFHKRGIRLFMLRPYLRGAVRRRIKYQTDKKE